MFVLATIPILTYGMLSIAIIGYCICSLISAFSKIKNGISKNEVQFLVFQVLFYVIFCFSYFYSDDRGSSIRIIQHSLPILLFPILNVVSPRISVEKHALIEGVFVLSSAVLAVYISSFLLIKYGANYVFTGSVVYNVIRSDHLYLDVHPIYTSIFFVFSIILIFNRLLHQRTKYRLGYFFLIALFLLPILILASKAIFLVLGIAVLTLLFSKNRISIKSKWLVLLVVAFVFIGLAQTKMLNNRISSFLSFFTDSQGFTNSSSSTFLRMETYACSFELAKKHFWAGVGLGDVQYFLDVCYSSKDISTSVISAHNFYLRILLSCGIAGLLFFIYSIYYNFYQISHKKLQLYRCFILCFMLLMLFEDYLIRAYGVSFYAYINHIYYISRNDT